MSQPNIVEGIRVGGVISLEGEQCCLVLTFVVVEEVDDVSMANVAVKESYECLRSGRSSCGVWVFSDSDTGCPAL